MIHYYSFVALLRYLARAVPGAADQIRGLHEAAHRHAVALELLDLGNKAQPCPSVPFTPGTPRTCKCSHFSLVLLPLLVRRRV